MKKSSVAIGIIVALGIAWVGGSWYTGKLIEDNLEGWSNTANNSLKNYFPNSNLKLNYSDVKRGIFSTTLKITLENSANNSSVTADKKIILDEIITHGPFPNLSHASLMPSMASVNTQLENTPAVKAWFDATQGKTPFNADTVISYSGTFDTSATLLPANYKDETHSINFSGATLDIKNDIQQEHLEVALNSDNLVIKLPEKNGEMTDMVLNGIQLNQTSQKGRFDVAVGHGTLTVKKLAIGVNDKEISSLSDLKIENTLNEQDQFIDAAMTYSLNNLILQGNNFGSATLALKVGHLDGNAMKQLVLALRNYNQTLVNHETQNDLAAQQEAENKLSALWVQQLPLLLQGNPTLSITPFNWKNSKGESDFKLDLTLMNPAKATENAPAYMAAQSVKKLNATLTLPLSMATEVALQSAKLEGYNEQEAEKMAQQQVAMLSTMGQMFKVVTLKDNVMSSSFHYADNQVDLNGQKMTLAEFMQMLGQ